MVFCKAQAFLPVGHRICGTDVAHGGGSGGMGELDRVCKWPAFMQSIKRTGRKRVPRAIGSGNAVWRHVNRRQDMFFSAARDGDSAAWKMNDDQFHLAGLQYGPGIGKAGLYVGVLIMAYWPTGDGSNLEFIDDQVVEMLQAGHDQLMQTIGGQGA